MIGETGTKTKSLELLVERPLGSPGTALGRENVGLSKVIRRRSRRYGIFRGAIGHYAKFIK